MQKLLLLLEAHRAEIPGRYLLIVNGVRYRVDPEFVGLEVWEGEVEREVDCRVTITEAAIEALVKRPTGATIIRLTIEKSLQVSSPSFGVSFGKCLLTWL